MIMYLYMIHPEFSLKARTVFLSFAGKSAKFIPMRLSSSSALAGQSVPEDHLVSSAASALESAVDSS